MEGAARGNAKKSDSKEMKTILYSIDKPIRKCSVSPTDNHLQKIVGGVSVKDRANLSWKMDKEAHEALIQSRLKDIGMTIMDASSILRIESACSYPVTIE